MIWIVALVQVDGTRTEILELKAGILPDLMPEIEIPLIHAGSGEIMIDGKVRI